MSSKATFQVKHIMTINYLKLLKVGTSPISVENMTYSNMLTFQS